MYLERILEVAKIDNGYVVEARVPLKRKKDKDGCIPCDSGADKQILCKDEKEAASAVEKLLPLLDTEYSTKKEFESAFDEAAKDMEDDEENDD
jgi:hypothetical protein